MTEKYEDTHGSNMYMTQLGQLDYCLQAGKDEFLKYLTKRFSFYQGMNPALAGDSSEAYRIKQLIAAARRFDHPALPDLLELQLQLLLQGETNGN